MPESLYGAPYLCMHRADLHEALALGGARREHPSRQEARRPRPGGGQRDAVVRRRHASAGRCGDRRRRRAFAGARAHRRAGRADPSRAASPIARCFRSSLMNGERHRPLAHEMVGPRPPHRHLLHDARQRSELYFVTSVPEPAEWLTRESWSAKGDVQRIARGLRGLPSPMCATCSKPARIATSGRSSSASRCRAGARAASCCWATPAIR